MSLIAGPLAESMRHESESGDPSSARFLARNPTQIHNGGNRLSSSEPDNIVTADGAAEAATVKRPRTTRVRRKATADGADAPNPVTTMTNDGDGGSDDAAVSPGDDSAQSVATNGTS